MSDQDIAVIGCGAVSPAGWGVDRLIDAVRSRQALPSTQLQGSPSGRPLTLRRVPPPAVRPAFLAQPRLRRSSAISQFCISAALEAMGGLRTEAPGLGARRMGLVFCTMTGSVVYSRRYYEEVLQEPATASPLLFPETVYNAPASHLAAVLGIQGRVHTEVGDAGCYLKALATAEMWLQLRVVDRCLVVAAEESDWLVGDGLSLLSRTAVGAEGAAAMVLCRADEERGLARIVALTDPVLYGKRCSPGVAIQEVRRALEAHVDLDAGRGRLLVESTGLNGRLGRADEEAWKDWQGERWSPKAVLGEAWAAGAAWQCVAAVAGLSAGSFAQSVVSVVGSQENAMGVVFARSDTASASA